MTTFLSKLYDQLVVEKPKIALLLTLMITIGMSLGLANFKLDASADSLTLERETKILIFIDKYQKNMAQIIS